MQIKCKKKEEGICAVKKALGGLRFKTLMSRMWVEFDTGAVIYNSATQAAEDLRRRGFAVDSIVPRTKDGGVAEETSTQLAPWETAGPRLSGAPQSKKRLQQQALQRARDRLKESGEDM